VTCGNQDIGTRLCSYLVYLSLYKSLLTAFENSAEENIFRPKEEEETRWRIEHEDMRFEVFTAVMVEFMVF